MRKELYEKAKEVISKSNGDTSVLEERRPLKSVKLVGTKLRNKIVSNDASATAEVTTMTNNSAVLNTAYNEAVRISMIEGVPLNEALEQVLNIPEGFNRVLNESGKVLAYLQNKDGAYSVIPASSNHMNECIVVGSTLESALIKLSRLPNLSEEV